MAYGEIKIDTITFTDGGIDKSVSISGLVQNPTFSGNITVTGTISGNTLRGQTVSGVTVTGTTAQFASGTFTSLTGTTTQGTTASFTTGTFTSLTGTTLQGTTATYTTGSFTSLTGTTTQGTTASFTTGTFTSLTGTTTTGTTATFTTGVFSSSISGAVITATSGVIASGTAANPSLSILGDPNTGIYSPGADQVAISTNGTGRLFVDASGNVGFNVNPPTSYTNYTTLSINGATGGAVSFRSGGTMVGEIFSTSSALNLSANTSQPLVFQTNGGTERLRITSTGTLMHLGAGNSTTPAVQFNGSAPVNSLVMDSSGRLGLGTSSASKKLQINYTDNANHSTSNGTYDVLVWNTADISTYPTCSAGIQLRAGNSSAGAGSIHGIRKGPSNQGELAFAITDASGNNVEKARFTSTGLGIGTTSPGSPLSVVSNSSALGVAVNGRSLDNLSQVNFYANNGTTLYGRIQNSSTATLIGSISELTFGTGGSLTERARIDSSGRLLVGTSSDQGTATLQIQGDSASATNWGKVFLRRGQSIATIGGNVGSRLGQLDFGNQDGAVGATIQADSDATWGSGDYPTRLVFSTTAAGASSPGTRMTINNSGNVTIAKPLSEYSLSFNGAVTTWRTGVSGNSGPFYVVNNGGTGVQLGNNQTAWTTASDERLKTNLLPIENGLDKVSTLRAVTGRYLTDEAEMSRSFLIAQDVQAVLPEAVSVEEDDQQTLGLRYTEVIPLLVSALKESKQRIEVLEAKVNALEGN